MAPDDVKTAPAEIGLERCRRGRSIIPSDDGEVVASQAAWVGVIDRARCLGLIPAAYICIDLERSLGPPPASIATYPLVIAEVTPT